MPKQAHNIVTEHDGQMVDPNNFFPTAASYKNFGTIYDRRTEMAKEYFTTMKALGVEPTVLTLGNAAVPTYEVALDYEPWNATTTVLAMSEVGGIYEVDIKEDERGDKVCLLTGNPELFTVGDLDEFFDEAWNAMVKQLRNPAQNGRGSSYVGYCGSHRLGTTKDNPVKDILFVASRLVAEHCAEQMDNGSRGWVDSNNLTNEIVELTKRKKAGNFVAAAIEAIGEDNLFADEDAALEFDRHYYSNHTNKEWLARFVARRAVWLLKHAGYPTDACHIHSVSAKPVITEAVETKNDIVPAVDVTDEVNPDWQDIAEKSLRNERWTTAKRVETLLRVGTDKPTHLFTDDDCPFHWADYPEGYSVFHTTENIHTRQRPVAVYYKGLSTQAALEDARTLLIDVGLGFVCPPPTKGSSTRQSRLVVTKDVPAVLTDGV